MSRFILPEEVFIFKSGSASDKCYLYAVQELRRLLGRIGIRSRTSNISGSRRHSWLLVSIDQENLQTAPGVKGLLHDGFSITVGKGGVSMASPCPKGILNAVYEFAERLGFLFLMPGDAGEWAPELGGRRPSLPEGSWKFNPRFPWRGVFGGCDIAPFSEGEWFRFFAKLKFNAVSYKAKSLPVAEETGIRLEIGGHGMSELLPRELFARRPELFRMFQPEDFGGKRMSDSNFCPNHPAAKKIVKENFRRKIAALGGIYAVHAWADDLPGGGWCLCPLCRSYAPTDQAMIVMRHLCEVLAEEKSRMRVPVIAYHDTMLPGKLVPAPSEGFLLFAPRERCYSHSIDDPSCAKNRFYLKALREWTAKFAGIDDAHTFEYYFDQILFRGLYPFIPDVILGDMAAYEKAGIQSHMSLQVGGPVVAPEFNMLVFAKAHWDAKLTAERFIRDVAAGISPEAPSAWSSYLQKRRSIFASAMRLCELSNDIYYDYRWLPETPQPFARKMSKAYATDSKALDKAAADLLRNQSAKSPARARKLAVSEAGRARFESADLLAMSSQQDGVNKIADYVETASLGSLRSGLKSLRDAVSRLDKAYEKAKSAGLPESAYYYALNRNWLQREFKAKIKSYEEAFR